MSDRITDAMQAIGAVLRLLPSEDRRVVVQATYNVELERYGNDTLLRLGGAGVRRPTPPSAGAGVN
jgi:hypothetical protein